MKKIWLITLISILLGVVSCSNGDDEKFIYTVTFDADGGAPTPSVQKVESGSPATAPDTNPAKTGYVFMFWHLSGSTVAYNFQAPVNNDITLYAKWQEEAAVEYWRVSWQLNDGSWPSGDNHATQVVKGGTLAEPAAPVRNGYTFEGWYKEATLTNKVLFPYDVSTVTGNFTLYAKWTTGGEEPGPGDDTPPTAMYIVGKEFLTGCCWKVDLATGNIDKITLTPYGGATDIVLSGSDIYISGYITNLNGKNQACYWKNGIMTLLSPSGKDFEGNAIAVSGTDIYVACDEGGGGTKPCYTKNGALTYLSTSQQYAWATDIALSGDNVYISGGEGSAACYWMNGNKTSLISTHSTRESRSIFVSETDVYVSGRVRYPGWTACYWKNGSFVSLTDGTKNAAANAIITYKNKVYAAGEEDDGRNNQACYWVNGNKVSLGQSPSPSSYAHDIAVSGNDVYVVGSIWNNNDKEVACYWKNGVRVDLTSGTKSNAEALAVAFSWE